VVSDYVDSEQGSEVSQTFKVWLEQWSLNTNTFSDEAFYTQPFVITSFDKEAAWAIHIELRSRITTQDLPYHSGDEATALKSLYSLFSHHRELLTEIGYEASTVGLLSLWMLNEYVRPITGYWHGAERDGKLEIPDDAGDFRGDLRELRFHLCVFTDVFGFIARGESYRGYELTKELHCPTPPTTIEPKPVIDSSFFDKQSRTLYNNECGAIHGKRTGLEYNNDNKQTSERIHDRVGLALSGGGIRSATFCMGVLQALSRKEVFRHFDYMSTVSGGGYTGALISSWMRVQEGNPSVQDGPFAASAGEEPEAVRRIRNRSRYLMDANLSSLMSVGGRVGVGILCALALFYIAAFLLQFVIVLGSWISNTILQFSDAGAVGEIFRLALVPLFVAVSVAFMAFQNQLNKRLRAAIFLVAGSVLCYGIVYAVVSIFNVLPSWLSSKESLAPETTLVVTLSGALTAAGKYFSRYLVRSPIAGRILNANCTTRNSIFVVSFSCICCRCKRHVTKRPLSRST